MNGIESPNPEGAHPWRLVKRRPKVLAFAYRILGWITKEAQTRRKGKQG